MSGVKNKAEQGKDTGVTPEVMSSGDLARAGVGRQLWDDSQLRDINSFADLETALDARDDIAVADVSEFGHGYSVLDDKRRLVGVDMYIIDWRWNVATRGSNGEFVSLQVLTERGDKWIVNDGSTGISKQIRQIETANGGEHAVLRVRRGLTESQYKYTDDEGKEKDASTFYLSFSK